MKTIIKFWTFYICSLW